MRDGPVLRAAAQAAGPAHGLDQGRLPALHDPQPGQLRPAARRWPPLRRPSPRHRPAPQAPVRPAAAAGRRRRGSCAGRGAGRGAARSTRCPVDRHFFDDLGADSMVMAQFCARLRKRADLPTSSMKDVYQHSTIRAWPGARPAAAPARPSSRGRVRSGPRPSGRARRGAAAGRRRPGADVAEQAALLPLRSAAAARPSSASSLPGRAGRRSPASSGSPPAARPCWRSTCGR